MQGALEEGKGSGDEGIAWENLAGDGTVPHPAHGNGYMTRCLHQNYTQKRVHFIVSLKINFNTTIMCKGPTKSHLSFTLTVEGASSPHHWLLYLGVVKAGGAGVQPLDSGVLHLPAERPSHRCSPHPHQQGEVKNKLGLTVCIKSRLSEAGCSEFMGLDGHEQTLSTGL